ncbi:MULTISPECIES: carbohydrate ABC transporter permease [Bacillaceae]|uniref:carbohydrate ABC transporter permease n=1 Tax=Bacillaceae TaxID=186817 RepID=UPI001BCA299D|nr:MULTISPECIES: carbohydrate ABC transporter permease [Bacillaceae]MBS4219064.1 carbohydrate ABC transporter permease [Bacillus sp. FJAT-49711]MCR2822982.1 carbohydrate ABC transporter permease [Lederbergia panacisoli]
MRKKLSVTYIVLIIFLSVASFIMFMPYLWMVLSSLKSNMEIIQSKPSLLPANPTFSGYEKVINDAPFIRWFFNSLYAAVLVCLGTLFSSALAGYVFASFRFRGKRIIFVAILATMMIPFQIIMIPTYLIISKLNLINNIHAIIIPYLTSAFGIFLCKQFIEGIPRDIIESARVDGASEFRTFRSLIIPQITPVLSALGIFTFMSSWNNYIWPLIVLNEETKMTVPLALVFFNSQNTTNFNVVMSAAVLIMVPVFIVFLIFQRRFVEGLVMTGIKG